MRYAIILGLYFLAALRLTGQTSDQLARKAQEDLRAGQYSLAEQELSQVLKAQPSNWKLWYQLGLSRVQLGQNGTAIEAFERAHRLAPREALPDFGLGLLYMKKGEIERAVQAYRSGLALDAKDEAANQNYGVLLMQKGDFRGAVEPLKRLKSLRRDNVATRATLIDAYLKAGMKGEGENEVRQLLGVGVASLQEELALAKLLLGDGDARAATEVLRHAAATWPDAAKAHGDLGLLLLQAEQYEPAVGELGRAAQLDPNSPEYALGLGEALLRWRHDPIALQYLQAVQQKFGNLPLYKFELGLAYFNLTRFPAAQQVFESLAQEQPKSSRVQYLLGATYQSMGKLTDAEACYRKAIALKPDEASYYLTLATLLKKVNPADLTEPVHLSEKGVSLSPENEAIKLLLASCYQAQGKLEEAQALLESVITRNPDSRVAHVAMAQVYFRQKRVQDAEQQEAIAAKLQTREQNEVSPWGPGGVDRP